MKRFLPFVFTLSALPAFAEPPRVVADIAPIHALVAQVMDGVAEPGLLLEQDANPHAVQLRPGQARMLEAADLVIWVGPGLSPWMERALDTLGDAEQIVLMEDPSTTLRDFTQPEGAEVMDEHDDEYGEEHDDDHAEEHDDEHADEVHDEHDHGDKDPHLWMSVDNARAWLPVFAEHLSALDPENADTYTANAARADADLAELTQRIETRLAPHQGAEIVTFHAAFGYFADRFGITIAGTVRPGDAASPSAAAMIELERLVTEHEIECVFAEPAFDPGLLKAISGGDGLRMGYLDPTGALQTPGKDHYAATLEAVANEIATCLEAE